MKTSKATDPVLYQLLDVRPRKSDVRRLEIVETTIEVLSTLGLEGCTFENVGKRIDMSRSQILYYFKDRPSLFQAVTQFISRTAQQETINSIRGIDNDHDAQLEALIRAPFVWARAYPTHAVALPTIYHLCTVSKEMRKLQAEIRESGAERIAAALSRKYPVKHRSLEDYLPLARAAQWMLTGCILESVSTESKAVSQEREDICVDAVKRMLEQELTRKPKSKN